MPPSPNTPIPSEILVRVDGYPIAPTLRENIFQVTVEESLHLPGLFTLVFHNTLGCIESGGSLEKIFVIGQEIEIGIWGGIPEDSSRERQEKNLFKGEIRVVETHFTHESQGAFVVQGKLKFRRSQPEEVLTLRWPQDLHCLRARMSGAEQPHAPEPKAPISVTHGLSHLLMQPVSHGDLAPGLPSSPQPRRIGMDQPVLFAVEPESPSPSGSQDLKGESVQGSAAGPGNPKIQAGQRVRLQNLSLGTGDPQATHPFDGEYIVTQCRHLYQQHTYTTEFLVRSLHGEDRLNPISNGISISMADQDLTVWEGRKFPLLKFVQDDNGGQQQEYSLQIPGDHKIKVTEDKQRIELETAGGLKITMDDSSKNITLSSNGSLDIRADGNIRIRGMNVYIN